MVGTHVRDAKAKWVHGTITMRSEDSYGIDMLCDRCGERQHRVYCCFDRAKDLGLRCFAQVHFGCGFFRNDKKEQVL